MNCVPIFYLWNITDSVLMILYLLLQGPLRICVLYSIEWSLFRTTILTIYEFASSWHFMVINHCAKVTELLLWYFLEQLEAGKVPLLQRQWRQFWFPIGLKNTNLEEDAEILLSVKFRWIPFTDCAEKDENAQPIRGNSYHLGFPISPVDDVEILLAVKFYWNLFSSCREEV